MEILEQSYIARRENCAASTNCQSNQFNSGASICSAPQALANGGDVALAADTAVAEASANQLSTAHDDETPLPGNSVAVATTSIKPGDYVQWESNGELKMPAAKRLSHFSDDGNFAFVAGSTTGVPAMELITVERPPAGETAIMNATPATKAGINAAPVEVSGARSVDSTNQPAIHNLAYGSAYSFVNLLLEENGKFTVSAAEMTAQLAKQTDDEIDAMVKQANGAELEGVQLSIYGRCTVGAYCWEKRRRINEMKSKHFKTITWEKWCTSVGLRSPKSAKRWAENWQTVQDTSAALANAVVLAGIDLFLPRVAEGLRFLNAELAGRELDTAWLPVLLAQLKELIKRKKPSTHTNEHKAPVVRPASLPINDDPYGDEDLLEGAESEEEVRLYVAAAIKHLALYDPLLRAYAALTSDATVEARAETLFRFTGAGDRELFLEVWTRLLRDKGADAQA
jgi:plastocyanin